MPSHWQNCGNKSYTRKDNSIQNGILSWGWLWWFRKHDPYLSLHVAQGHKVGRAKGLCPNKVAMTYDNLHYVYGLQNYDVSKIWNYDEFGVQVGCNGDALVLVKIG